MASNIDETELARLDALAKEATSLPWRGDGHKECGYGWVKIPGLNTTGTERSAMLGQYLGADDDARYIAAACNAVPALVAEVRRLRRNYECSEKSLQRHEHMVAELMEKVEAWEWYGECLDLWNNSQLMTERSRLELWLIRRAAREAVHADRE